MGKAKQFYLEHIMRQNHVIGGSTAIKKQIPLFREPSDIDLMIPAELFEVIKMKLNDEKIEKSSYGCGIYSVIFDDKSKLDFIIGRIDYLKTVTFDGLKYLNISEIIKYKFELIRKSINGKCFNEHNKHLEDILFIFGNFDEYEINKIETKIEQIPF